MLKVGRVSIGEWYVLHPRHRFTVRRTRGEGFAVYQESGEPCNWIAIAPGFDTVLDVIIACYGEGSSMTATQNADKLRGAIAQADGAA